MNFEEAFAELLGNEGGYVNHPEDPGGATRWGITARVAVKNGYTGDMRDFPVLLAQKIARTMYWDAVRADDLPAGVRFDVFDAAYNHGPKQAVLFLQRALRVNVDGILGALTLEAAKMQDSRAISMRFNAERIDLYTTLPTWGAFGKGWSRRIRDNLRRAASAV